MKANFCETPPPTTLQKESNIWLYLTRPFLFQRSICECLCCFVFSECSRVCGLEPAHPLTSDCGTRVVPFPLPHPPPDYFLYPLITNNSLLFSTGQYEGLISGFRFSQGTEQTLIPVTRRGAPVWQPHRSCPRTHLQKMPAHTLQPLHVP